MSDILRILDKKKIKSKIKIDTISDLNNAGKNDISFFNSTKYISLLKRTKSRFIITDRKYESIVLKYSNPIIVEHVHKSVAHITHAFYPDSLNDFIDYSLSRPLKSK